MKRSRVNLEVVLREVNFILENIYPVSETVFENDSLIQRATILSLIIIGEEANKVDEALKSKYVDVPWSMMSGMRNKMVHNYDGIDTAIIWNTVKIDIPELKKQIEKILLNEND